ncbi:transcription termination/antitermination protein NusG [Buchnera aphidicola (Thelaxes californica)]|uniref:Transcription termination/antitermination protein NusG n=1 Tax=Buchnera aphidicola (Thelaxes californica) TaxID=1315998 RepID=A0A4D6YEW8_9GAMM|nr:transcription termination/antitermination protein NusG [Buchnera aphidicola]QCI26593.1 transcription termination/antitermination protein NusG [Buchnera aphidicola (Thelaxes californica)]
MVSIRKRWYALQAFSGCENRIANSIKEYIHNNHLESIIGKVLVPSEEVIEIKKGQKKKSEQKFFPGYVLIHMIMNNETWHLVKSIPHVMGFVGGNSDCPSVISDAEVEKIIIKLNQLEKKPRPKILFEPGETIRVINGPFSDFNGIVEKLDYEKNRLTVSISIFGRSTPVELDFDQVEKS